MLPSKLAFVDLETTGGSPVRDRIIEVGIVLVEGGQVVETFQSLVNPQTYLPPEITQFTGITPQDLENAPSFNSLKQEIFSLLEGNLFVAHNARFDYGFLKNEFKQHNVSFTSRQLCTVKLSRKVFPFKRHHNLDAIISEFGIPMARRHRALDDAQATWEFYRLLTQTLPPELLDLAVTELTKKPTLPANISPESLEKLPESPGVYIFYDQAGAILYVGKSKNIRDRVLSHFQTDYTSTKEMRMAQSVYSIDTIITSGELGALLLESQLIKKHQPLFNRQLRRYSNLTIAYKDTTPDGYFTIKTKQSSRVDPQDLDSVIGIFKSKKDLQELILNSISEHQLCDCLLGLQKGPGPCFSYQLERCKGACVGLEKPEAYNLRFLTAFLKSRIKSWPFPGKILIREIDSLTDKSSGHIIDHWCYLGSVNSDSEVADFTPDPEARSFDLDTYKILRRFLTYSKGHLSIRHL